MSTPPSAAPGTIDAARSSFADDVERYLSLTPRRLPSRYFYDEAGSALFAAICHLPWYKISRTERRLLELHAPDIFARAGRLSTLVELGPGGGEKLATLLSAHARPNFTIHLIDVSPSALDAARRALGTYPDLIVALHQATYETGLAAVAGRRRGAGQTLVLCLGSNIGNFDPPEAHGLLQAVRAALNPGDLLLLGADLVKPERELLLAYDDPWGVTAAFNRNLLVRANRELGANFDLAAFAHRARWNAAASRIEMHLVSLTRQRVCVPASSNLEIVFDEGEAIWTESSYKYDSPGIAAMLDGAGFGVADQWIADGFALTRGEAR